MTPEKRSALLSVLAERGDTEFWVAGLSEPFKAFFADHASVFEAYLDGLNRRSSAEPISFLYLNRPDFNACAFRFGIHRFIGFNWGAVVLIHDLFLRMLACPEVFPLVGDCAAEEAPEKHARLLLDARGLPSSETDPFGLAIAPYDPVRGTYAYYLARIALDFLLMHEWQHAAGGHHRILGGPLQTRIPEFNDEPWMGDLLTRHVLECEADTAAANFTLGRARDQAGNVWRIPEAIRPFLRTEEERIASRLFAILTLFVVMEEGTLRLPRRGTHPSPLAMRAFLIATVSAARGPLGGVAALGQAMEVLGQVDQAVCAVAERPDGKRLVIDHVGHSREEHMDLLRNRWLELLPRLTELAKESGTVCAPASFIEAFCNA